MRLLLTNDDGLYADGIFALAKRLQQDHEVTIVAPESERSASSHSLTLSVPLRVKPKTLHGLPGITAYALNGTPVDCVKTALEWLLVEPPDCVISGINCGWNLGNEIWYSGTFNAASEAVLLGIPAIAVSCSYQKRNFDETAEYMPMVIDLMARWPDERVPLLNVNAPELPLSCSKGLCFVRTGRHIYDTDYHVKTDPRGEEYFYLPGTMKIAYDQEDTDVVKVRQGYMTVTPITVDLNDYEALNALTQQLECNSRGETSL